ncbi:MAG: UDP-N-acetylmuramoyl-L-alanyl-D-glutamate--2,6-diaminopimelate ligase [Desulfovermiculus sp.]|nr:UDP-N-acetylmuramoyl-L-alanyl-D-glutamate--2,6-diaminopimelate ligase [Desulfovermiculus sp.]
MTLDPKIISNRSSAWEDLLDYVQHGAEVRTHSGKVQPGDVFVALPGTTSDGSCYIPQAIRNRAAWVIHPEHVRMDQAEARFVPCRDVATVLGHLAATRYKTDRRRPFLIGITGTNGKTTVSYLVEHILRSAGKECGVIGTISYRWKGRGHEADLTTPGCLDLHAMLAQMAEEKVEVACMEVSSHALAQRRTAGLVFDLTVFTNLTQDHLDYHQDMETYFQVKSQLFTDSQNVSVLNFDDPYGRRLVQWAKPGRGCSLTRTQVMGWPCLQGRVKRLNRRGQVLVMEDQNHGNWTLRSGLVGRHNACNLLTAQAIGLELGLRPEDLQALESFTGPPGRLQRIINPQGLHIFVDYAHTPDALDNVLSAVKELDFKRLFVVFGCGGDRDPGKRPLMGRAVAKHAHVAVLTSDNPRNEDPEQIMRAVLPGLEGCPRVEMRPDRRQAIIWAIEALGPEDALIIAGKGHECTQQIGDQKRPFSDEQVVLECLKG